MGVGARPTLWAAGGARTAYALLRIHTLYFQASPMFRGVWTESLSALALVALALLCWRQPGSILRRAGILSVVPMAYGAWLLHQFGRYAGPLAGALHGDDLVLGYLSGVGFVGIGVLVGIAWAVNRGARGTYGKYGADEGS
jgi:hypothetical protein